MSSNKNVVTHYACIKMHEQTINDQDEVEISFTEGKVEFWANKRRIDYPTYVYDTKKEAIDAAMKHDPSAKWMIVEVIGA